MDTETAMEMPRYQSHKVVHALQIVDVDWDYVESAKLIVESPYTPITVSNEWIGKHAPNPLSSMVGGYYVVYDDGHTSYSPKKAFEAGYTRI